MFERRKTRSAACAGHPVLARYTRGLGLAALSVSLLLIGVGGLYGGSVFLLDPSGGLMGMSLRYLDPLPLSSYFWPGVWLFVVMGVCPLLVLYGLWARPHVSWFASIEERSHAHWAWTAALTLSVVLLLQLGVELSIGMLAPPTIVTGLLGVVALVCVLLPPVRDRYSMRSHV
jgi:hypothetical protein